MDVIEEVINAYTLKKKYIYMDWKGEFIIIIIIIIIIVLVLVLVLKLLNIIRSKNRFYGRRRWKSDE